MKLVGMAAAAASAFLRIPRSQSLQHFVGCNRAIPFGFAFSSLTGGGGEGDSESSTFPRPKTVPWRKEFSNTVHLIGNIDNPVQMKYTEEGKAVAFTKLEVKSGANLDAVTWYQLNFLEELAGTAAEHLKAFDQVYVSGCLDFEKVAGGDNDPRTLCQVWVNRLNFVDYSTTSVNADQDFELNSSASLQSEDSEGKNNTADIASTEALWRLYFDNPTKWWDNRNNKKNPKGPDFKHKDTGEGLWINNLKNPSWVKSKLDLLDMKSKLDLLNEKMTVLQQLTRP